MAEVVGIKESEIVTQRRDKPAVTSVVHIEDRGEHLGKGVEGTVSRVDVTSQRAPERTIQLAYKELTSKGAKHYEKTFKNYALTKEAGLPVPGTFRATEDEKGILITDLSEGGKNLVLSQNDVGLYEARTLYKEKSEIAQRFAHSEDLLSDTITEKLKTLEDKATEAGIFIPADAWFVVVKPDGSYDFVLGDFTRIDQNDNREQLQKNNHGHLYEFRQTMALVQKFGTDPASVTDDLIDIEAHRQMA